MAENSKLESLLDEFLDYLRSKFSLTPRRFDFFIWLIIIWICLLNDSERLAIINTPLKLFPPKIEIISALTASMGIKFVLAVIFSFIAHISLHFFVKSSVGYLKTKNPFAMNELAELLDTKAGLQRIYPSSRGVPAYKQPYSSDVCGSLKETTEIRLLSIAGYEYIGRGEALSLFYDALREKYWIKAEIIILDPTNEDTINERIQQLKRIDASYTGDMLKKHIEETTKKCKLLKQSRGDDSIKLYYCKFHPIFRLIILDDCLFMSTYETALHGHESPVYKIDKENSPEKLSLYNSYLNFFEKIKQYSTPTSL